MIAHDGCFSTSLATSGKEFGGTITVELNSISIMRKFKLHNNFNFDVTNIVIMMPLKMFNVIKFVLGSTSLEEYSLIFHCPSCLNYISGDKIAV